ncbi:MAG: cysteine desulfurase family protein [Candidatus Omnitrophota bacterium]|nr:cysteine desulfurase family protein [Candidatus Omnitrophota bacterium]
MDPVYLDHAATTPCDPRVVEALRPYFYEAFGNTLSPHAFGRRSRKAVEDAREILASFLGAQPTEIVFTSSATESNNHVILGVARALKSEGRHLVVSAIEHHCVLEPARRLMQEGCEATFVSPDKDGIISPTAIEQALRPDTILIAVAHANNEIGTIQPIADIGRIARKRGIYFLVDAAQTIGHIPVSVTGIPCDLLSFSAHKFYGPQGVGALYMRKGIDCPPLLLGGDHERGSRAGTLNVPGIVGLGEAVRLCGPLMSDEMAAQTALRDRIINAVLKEVPGTTLNGHRTLRLPNNAHFSFEGVLGEDLVAALDMAGIAVSVGSACTSGQLTPSHVLKAIGLSDAQALGALRISVGRWTTAKEVDYFLEQLKLKIKQLRG